MENTIKHSNKNAGTETQREIPSVLDDLETRIMEIEEAINRLYVRVKPVLGGNPTTEPDSRDTKACRSEIAEIINKYCDKLEFLTDSLNNITDQIEL